MRHARSIAGLCVDAFARALSFALLVLALLSYCGLPSNPPDDLFKATWLQLANADEAGTIFVAPSQAKEYRARDVAADDDGLAAAKVALAPAGTACVPACAWTKVPINVNGQPQLAAMQSGWWRSRAPPKA